MSYDLTPSQLIALGTPAHRFANTPRGSSREDAVALVRLGFLVPIEWVSDVTGAPVHGFQRTGRGEAVLAEHAHKGAGS